MMQQSKFFSWKIETHLYFIVSIMTANIQTMQEYEASAGIVLDIPG